MSSGIGEAMQLKASYEAQNLNLIIRDGVLDDCPYRSGDYSILRRFKGCVLAVHLNHVEQTTYAALTDQQWLDAGYKTPEEGKELVLMVDGTLDKPVCLLHLDLSSLSVKRIANRFGKKRSIR
jgi:hypothetical protein